MPQTPCRALPPDGRFLAQLGPTPLVPVRLQPDGPAVWCKLEFLNPSGSTKDRIARYMLEKAWRQGTLRPGDTVAEASSGSTSISLALACAQMGLQFVAVMPEGVTEERVLTIRAYGGEVVLTPKTEGVRGAMAHVERLAREQQAFAPRQFENRDNAEAHRVWTGQEVLAQIPGGAVDAVVSGVGTGGTIVGLYQAFSEAGCPVTAWVPRPVVGTGALADVECCSFSSRVPGVVEGLSKLFDPTRLKGLVELDIADDVAIATARALIRRGFPVGPSSGLNYAGAVEAARRLGPSAQVVTVFPDRMERYFSTELMRRPMPSATAGTTDAGRSMAAAPGER
jgi:cysteine synthase A